MKFNILINQKAIIDNKLPLDLIDATILNYINDFVHTGLMLSKQYKGKKYYWVNYKHLIKEMPIIGITCKDSLYRRLKKICSAGMLIAYPFNQIEATSFYCFGKNYHLLIKDMPTDEKSEGTDEKPEGYGSKVGAPTDEKSDNYTIKNNSINNKKKVFVPPSLDEVIKYFKEKGFRKDVAIIAFTGYDENDWHDSQQKKISCWKQKMNFIWFKDENKIKSTVQKMAI